MKRSTQRRESDHPPQSRRAVKGSCSNKPLTRATDWTNAPVNNENERDRICPLVWKSTELAGKQCDEYPFHSTHEGPYCAWLNNYFLRPVDPSQNGSHGADLGVFYNRYRILENDPFWVWVK
ncbi:NucA/NucB deoxyribonuclease domain-containing protein [Streptosporangium canum]|uniref:NucA/NucB deoxyribonuclease domain-containing protein n=1 Tax=Streptosporangium canum TaxID=324952 RepID=UPI003F4D4261